MSKHGRLSLLSGLIWHRMPNRMVDNLRLSLMETNMRCLMIRLF